MGVKGYKLVRGVGVNDADYDVVKYSRREDGSSYKSWECPFYSDWTNMLTRCTSEDMKYSYDYSNNHNSTYIGCYCHPDWLYFSKFKAWAEQQEWEGNNLDKDLIGDGYYYSPDTCVYIPHIINISISRGAGGKGCLAYGVGRSGLKYKPFHSSVVFKGNTILRYKAFYTELEAHKYWISGKITALNMLLDEYDYLSDKRILEGIRGKISKLQHAYENDILLYKL